MLVAECALNPRIAEIGHGSQAEGKGIRKLRESNRDDCLQDLLIVKPKCSQRIDVCSVNLGPLKVQLGAEIEQGFIRNRDPGMKMIDGNLFRLGSLNTQ